ncbi:MAG: hypothetical protein INH13_26800 [Cupriavidus sp.]|nr:hypothetical protein [Cupriavidus sp.]
MLVKVGVPPAVCAIAVPEKATEANNIQGKKRRIGFIINVSSHFSCFPQRAGKAP